MEYNKMDSKNFTVEVEHEKRIKNGSIFEKEFKIEAKNNKKIPLSEVYKFYGELRNKHNWKNFIIKAMAADGYKTIKSQLDFELKNIDKYTEYFYINIIMFY
jgi:hypothetical protein